MSGHLPVIGAAAVSIIGACLATEVGRDPDGLDRLIEAYKAWPVLVAHTAAANPNSGKAHLARYVIAPDGRFAEFHWVEEQSTLGRKWRDAPTHISAFDGAVLRSTEPGGLSEYTESQPPGYSTKAPGPLQWAAAPAPVVPLLAEWLKSATDLKIATEGTETIAESASSQLRFRWDERLCISELWIGDPSRNHSEFTYSNFRPVVAGRPAVATRRRELLINIVNGKSKVVRDFTLDFEVTISERPERELSFDTKGLNLSKYDATSGDVTRPDGTLLYNKKAYDRLLDDGSIWMRFRPWALWLGGLVVATGLVLGIRRRLAVWRSGQE